MKFLAYIYWRLLNRNSYNAYHKHEITCLQILGIIAFWCLPFIFIIQNVTGIIIWNRLMSDDRFINRFVRIPLLLLPIYLGIHFFIKWNFKRFETEFSKFEKMNSGEKKKADRKGWLIIAATIVWFFIGMTSRDWIDALLKNN